MFKLPPLKDISRFFDESFKNEVHLITEDKAILCNGILLAARSAHIENLLKFTKNIPSTELSDGLPSLDACLDLVYGKSITIDKFNFRSIYKFGKIFEIDCMMEGIMRWVSDDVTYEIFWEVYFKLRKLGVSSTSPEFNVAVERFVSQSYHDFMENTFSTCKDNDEDDVISVFEIFSNSNSNNVSCDCAFTLLIDLLSLASDNNIQTPTFFNTSNCVPKCKLSLDAVISCIISYIEGTLSEPQSLISSYKCTDLLRKTIIACDDMENLREISILQNTIMHYRDVTVFSIRDLTWGLIQKLASVSTSYDTIRYFTKYTANATEIHPCIIAETALKWWSARGDEFSDMSFIKELVRRIQVDHGGWAGTIKLDSRYGNLVENFNLGNPPMLRFLFYKFENYDKTLPLLIETIRQGDGTPLCLPIKDVNCTNNMAAYKERIFSYDATIYPPYGAIKGHWFINCAKLDSCRNLVFRMLFFTTDTQQEILHYLEESTVALLKYTI